MTDHTAHDAHVFRWRFDDAEFDESRFALRVDGVDVELERRPLQVLALLLRHVDEVVTKRELFDQVWEGRITVDHVLATAVGKLRKALGDAAHRIRTVPRLGYRLTGPVQRTIVGRELKTRLDLAPGQPVPGRGDIVLERPLAGTAGHEVWLAHHGNERRVLKFALDGERLAALKREATVARLLSATLGERDDIVGVLDAQFAQPPCYLECEYGGPDLLTWAQTHDFAARPLAQRVALFLRIADAVAAAHAVGVLHKDLKPANVLVSEDAGGDIALRLCDFGSARLLQPERLAGLGITALGLTLTQPAAADSSGTPLYLAPELYAGQPPTMRSDVYALGLLLYQFAMGDFRRPLAVGWERDIADELLVDDIAAATDGDPMRRPASAAELAARLRTHVARRDARERDAATQRSLRAAQAQLVRARARRPWMIGMIVALAAGLAGSTTLYWRAQAARAEAERQAARSDAVQRFLTDEVIAAADPSRTGSTDVVDVLDRSAAGVAERFAGDPGTRAAIEGALGRAYRGLSERRRASTHLAAAADLHAQALGAGHPVTLQARYEQAQALAWESRFDEAAAVIERADADAAPELLDGYSLPTLWRAIARAALHDQQMEVAPALEAFRDADRLQRRLAPDDAALAAHVRIGLANAYLRLGRVDEAMAAAQALLDDAAVLAARPLTVAFAHSLIGRGHRARQDYGRALASSQEALSRFTALVGETHYSSIVELSTLSSIHLARGDCPAALDAGATALARMRDRAGAGSQNALVELGNLGAKQFACGEHEAGLASLRAAIAGLQSGFGEDNVAAQSFRFFLARDLASLGRDDEALALLDGLAATALQAGQGAPAQQEQMDALRGEILLRRGDEGAVALLRDTLAALERSGDDPETAAHVRAVLDDAP